MKRCTKCKEVKNKEDFHKDESHKDGLHTVCKLCSKKYNEMHKGEKKEYHKKWYEENKEKQKEYQIQYNKEIGLKRKSMIENGMKIIKVRLTHFRCKKQVH